ncbi:hypothetical protein Pelo_4337 [Pelomyxa schiedti]|nr:hypothetical protein Pelo_4337 [Pelomyxa schiedti]
MTATTPPTSILNRFLPAVTGRYVYFLFFLIASQAWATLGASETGTIALNSPTVVLPYDFDQHPTYNKALREVSYSSSESSTSSSTVRARFRAVVRALFPAAVRAPPRAAVKARFPAAVRARA